jgi:hypothetical protein
MHAENLGCDDHRREAALGLRSSEVSWQVEAIWGRESHRLDDQTGFICVDRIGLG